MTLLRLLDSYDPIDEADRVQAARVAAFVRSEPRCFERSLEKGHLTGSAWLVDPDHSRVLLTHHRKLNQWLQLGGHADGQTNLLDVALREAREESGIDAVRPISNEIFDLDVHWIPERPGEPGHHHYDIRFALEAQQTAFVVSAESHDLKWVPIASLETVAPQPEMIRMKRKWRERFGKAQPMEKLA